MKKVFSFVAVSLALALSASFISCKAPSGGSCGGNGSIVSPVTNGIVIDGTLFDNTSEVYVMRSAVTVSGEINSTTYGGVFIAGRTVTLSPFIMGKYEVTQELYTAVMNGNAYGVNVEPFYCKRTGNSPLVPGETQKYRPAEGMTWFDAVYFCNEFTKKTLGESEQVYNITDIALNSTYGCISSATVTMDVTKKGYRLPTEAEWEFAARGGDPAEPDWEYLFSGAPKTDGTSYNDVKNAGLDSVGWYLYNTKKGITGDVKPSSGSAGYGTHQVGSKGENSCNRLGIFDMSGNVEEYCYDWYASISTGNVTNPSGPGSTESGHVSRGGGWSSNANWCCVFYRHTQGGHLDSRSMAKGIRVVRNAN